MQKISVDIGFTCPNRDGSIGTGGCIYCNNASFVPGYCNGSDSVEEQLEKGKKFFGAKYPDIHYLAYFQAYTSTYSPDRAKLTDTFKRALAVDKIDGLVISTRPDCIDRDLLASVDSLDKPVIFEIGVETSHNSTLSLINRNHTWNDVVESITLCREYGFDVGVHLIMGLPGETEEMMLDTVEKICKLDIRIIKFHQLQIIKNTELHRRWLENPDCVHLFTLEEYLALCVEIIQRVPRHIAIERFTASSPATLLEAPRWGLKNYEFVNLLNRRIRNEN